MNSKNRKYPVLIALLSCWIALTIFMDFIAVPTLFRNLGDFFKAGDIGILLFSKLNLLEIILGSFLLGLISLELSRSLKKGYLVFGIAFILWIISMVYFIFLTPKISALTALWKQAEAQGLTGLGSIPDLQQEHQFYHRAYIWIDTVKLGLLAFLLGRFIYKREIA